MPMSGLPNVGITSRRFMAQWSFEPINLHTGFGIPLSDITYSRVAPFVGLDPAKELQDIKTFELHESTVPKGFSMSDLKDVNGHSHYALISDEFVLQFWLRVCRSMKIIGDEFNTRNSFGLFVVDSDAYMLYVRMEYEVQSDAERLEAIAQIIAESDECALINEGVGLSLPIHCIFSNGQSFEFFKYERTPHPTLLRGCFHGDPIHLQRGLQRTESEERRISDTVLDFLMQAYIACITTCYNRELDTKAAGPALFEWGNRLSLAKHVQEICRKAVELRQEIENDRTR